VVPWILPLKQIEIPFVLKQNRPIQSDVVLKVYTGWLKAALKYIELLPVADLPIFGMKKQLNHLTALMKANKNKKMLLIKA
jgi:hypothetical protein